MAFSDPQKNLEQLGLHAGAYVADLGAGSGAYTLAAAQLVGAGGRVYSIDVMPDLLARIKNAGHTLHLSNIEAIHGDIETVGGTRLADLSVDAALVSNVLFQIEHKEQFVDEIKRILKKDGRVLIVDWTDSFGGLGPHANDVVVESIAKESFEKKGFVFIKSIDAGDHHYGLIFRKA